MAITADQLASFAKYVDGDATQDADYLTQCWNEATELVTVMLGSAAAPDPIRNRAILEAGADLWFRKNTRTGVPQFDSELGTPEPFPVLRDPRTSARVILQPWLTPAIG